MGNTYFYQRISTKEKADKQSFQRQDKALKKYAKVNELKYDNRTVYKDDTNGATFDRQVWKALEGILQKGDTIVLWS